MKILFIHKQVLIPHNTGGKIRALNVLRHLARSHDVTYLCNLRPGEEASVTAMQELGMRVETTPARESKRGSVRFYMDLLANLASPRPFTINRNFDPSLLERAARLHAKENFDIIICDCVQMARHTETLQGTAKVLFQHNVEAQILKRYSENSKGPLAAYMALQYKKMIRFESKVGSQFDAVIAISEPDKAIFEKDYGWQHVTAIDTAVDVEYFRPDAVPGTEQDERVVFVGSMDWLPNQQGVCYFVREVWPKIRAKRPHATLQIVGRHPTADILSFHEVDGVEVLGQVADTRLYLVEAAVSVVPILVGGGTRLKIFEAMAMRKAVVSTTIGAEGLPVIPGEHIILADTADAFAAEVLGLLDNPERRMAIAQASHALVNQRFRSELVAQQFEEVCRKALQDRIRTHENQEKVATSQV
jgi:glycosyltransferase involved in cell wall biosynthesis